MCRIVPTITIAEVIARICRNPSVERILFKFKELVKPILTTKSNLLFISSEAKREIIIIFVN